MQEPIRAWATWTVYDLNGEEYTVREEPDVNGVALDGYTIEFRGATIRLHPEVLPALMKIFKGD